MAALNALFDKRKLALTRAKLRAWWEGDAFDEEAALAEIEAKLAAANDSEVDGDADDALFDEPEFDPPPRIVALGLMWGEGRVRPGDATADALEPARLGAPDDGVIAVLGPGQAAPVIAIAGAYPGKIEVYEWREEALEALKVGVRKAKLGERVTVNAIDIEAPALAAESLDGVISIDDFAYCSFAAGLAQHLMKALKPGACAVAEAYVGFKSADLATAFATAFAEPQIRPHGDVLHLFSEAGLQLESDEDLTGEFLETARASFKALRERLTDAGAIEPLAARELAWEAEAWRARLKMLAQRRLERRRFTLRKPTGEEPAEESAPEAAAATSEADIQALLADHGENANAPAD